MENGVKNKHISDKSKKFRSHSLLFFSFDRKSDFQFSFDIFIFSSFKLNKLLLCMTGTNSFSLFSYLEDLTYKLFLKNATIYFIKLANICQNFCSQYSNLLFHSCP